MDSEKNTSPMGEVGFNLPQVPYARVFAAERGARVGKWYNLPIRWDPRDDAYRIHGVEGLRVMKIELEWPTMQEDLIHARANARQLTEEERLTLENQKEVSRHAAYQAAYGICEPVVY